MNTPIVSAVSALEMAKRYINQLDNWRGAGNLAVVDRDEIIARAYIKTCEAVEKIVAKQYENRVTVTPESAFRHFGDLNQEVCEIYDIARAALSCSAPTPEKS